MQLQMAGNDEAKLAALQHALAIQDAVLAQPGSTPVLGGVGYRICSTGSTNGSCNQSTLTIDSALQPAIGRVDAVVTRVGPALARLPVMSEAMASSGLHYRVAKFEIRSTYDGSAEGLGKGCDGAGRVGEAGGPCAMTTDREGSRSMNNKFSVLIASLWLGLFTTAPGGRYRRVPGSRRWRSPGAGCGLPAGLSLVAPSYAAIAIALAGPSGRYFLFPVRRRDPGPRAGECEEAEAG